MFRLLSVLFLTLVLISPAIAGPNAGGTLIVHDSNLLLSATDGSVPVCAQGAALPACSNADTEIDGAGSLGGDAAVFRVYAAFFPGSSPRLMGLTWGVEYDAENIVLSAYGKCGDFELNDDAWPASGTGSTVTWNTVQTAPLVPVYWFAAYTLGAAGSFDLGPNPSQGGYFGDNTIPAILDPILAYGKMGFDAPGLLPCPEGQPAACCGPDGSCAMVIGPECVSPNVWQGPGTSCSPNPCPQLGACCNPQDGSCTVGFESACAAPSVWQGPDTNCTPNPCPQPGACCRPDGICEFVIQSDCWWQWLGPETGCTPNPCAQPSAACCHPDGSCTFVLQTECDGDWLGEGSHCEPNPCPQPMGACCAQDGSCVFTTEEGCAAPGIWHPEFSSCQPNPCPQPSGACCHPDGSCAFLPQADCNDQWLGWGSACAPNPCPQPGACCLPEGSCLMVPEWMCSGMWMGVGQSCTPNPCPQPGACCASDGSCAVLQQTECGGEWMGPATVCDPNPCPQPGACCNPEDGSCAFLLPAECAAPNIWQGPGTNCYPNPCPQPEGACCHADGTCTVTTMDQCPDLWQGADTSCTPNPCPQPGACCFSDGSCLFLLEMICWDHWMGPGTTCDPNPCPQPGACCDPASGYCTFELEMYCAPPRTWMGPGTGCDPNPCPIPQGACCYPDGTCTVTTPGECSWPGVWQGPDTVCEPNSCPQPGACCVADGSCVFVLQSQCGGLWMGSGTSCDPDPCPPTGACCAGSGSCTIRIEALCSGSWLGPGTTCVPNPCPQPQLGACCLGMVCVMTTQENCTGEWMGVGSYCSPNPCCRKNRPPHPIKPLAGNIARTAGPGTGVVVPRSPDTICPGSTLKANDDGSYENGYAWAYAGVAPPYYGAFAEGFTMNAGSGSVCGVKLALTQIGGQDGWLLDIYVWAADGDCGPFTVLGVTTGVNPGTIGMWPMITQHPIDINDCWASGNYFVGWWGNWVGTANGWYVAADENGFGGGVPRTNIAPGIGFPTGWNHPNVVSTFAGCQDLGIAVYEASGGGTPVERSTWGRIKAIYGGLGK